MEVTRHNFKETLDDVAKAISESDFLAIDGEFTGLGDSKCHIHAFDTPESRYQKLRKGAMDFLLIQFGMCAFRFDKETNKHVVKAFNFYTFPRPFSRQAPDQRFLCQTSSIEFLISQGFDFNKLFKDGISYLTMEAEATLRESLVRKHEQLSSQMTSPSFTSPHGDLMKGPIVIPEEQKAFIDGICEKIEAFIKSDDAKPIEIPPCNGFLRKLIYQTVCTKYKSSVHMETKTDKNKMRYLVVSRVASMDDFKIREQIKRKAEMEELDDAVGFSKVIKLISDSQKLVVGHNMLLDLLHVISNFRCTLPEDYEEFKSLANCVFPAVLDTKLMATSYPFKELIINSGLGNLQKILEEKPFTKPEVVTAEGFASYDTASERLHEAGYDAYITGLAFIGMADHLGTYQNKERDCALPASPLLQPFINKMFLMRVFDIPYMNLTEPDLETDRSHVFHLTFPKDWKTSDISQLFMPFGSVYISWLDDVSAFVSLRQKELSESVRKHLPSSETYRVMPYEQYMRKQEISRHPPITPTTNKRKVPTSDMDVSRPKRKRSSEGSPFTGANKIPPIQEEDEAEVDGEGEEKGDKPQSNGKKSTDEDLGVPVKKKKMAHNTDAKEDSLFEVPTAW